MTEGMANSTPQGTANPPQSAPTATASTPATTGTGVTFKGKVLQTPAEIQQALEQAEKFESRAGRQAQEIGQLRESQARLEGIVSSLQQPAQPQVDPNKEWEQYGEQLFVDPAGTLRKIHDMAYKKALDEAKGVIGTKEQEIRAGFQTQEAHKMLWDQFYEKHPALAEHRKLLVPAIAEWMKPQLAKMPTEEALEKIAEVATEQLLRNQRNAPGSNGNGHTEPVGKTITSPSSGGLPQDPMTYNQLHKSALDTAQAARSRIRPSTPQSNS